MPIIKHASEAISTDVFLFFSPEHFFIQNSGSVLF